MKKIYVMPEMLRIDLEQEDILTISVGDGNSIASIGWDRIEDL